MTSYRPSPGGSIAARSSSPVWTGCSQLVPPFTGRLHCGAEFTRKHGRPPSRTALHRAAPLRRRGAREVRCRHLLVPPFTGRLHCGQSNIIINRFKAHLSYRPSPGGSIAATCTSPDTGCGWSSYRPSPGGSIAAWCPSPRTRPASSGSYRPSPGGSIAAVVLHPLDGGAGLSYRPSPGGSIAAVPLCRRLHFLG